MCRTPSSRGCALRRPRYCRWSRSCSEPVWRRMNSTTRMYGIYLQINMESHSLWYCVNRLRVLYWNLTSTMKMHCRQSYSGSWRNVTDCGEKTRWATPASLCYLWFTLTITQYVPVILMLNNEPTLSLWLVQKELGQKDRLLQQLKHKLEESQTQQVHQPLLGFHTFFSSDQVLTCVFLDPVTNGSHLHLHTCLNWPLVIRSCFPASYAKKTGSVFYSLVMK